MPNFFPLLEKAFVKYIILSQITIEESGGIKRIKIVPSSSSTFEIPTSTIEMSSSLLRPMPSIASSSSLATSPSLVSSSGVAASLPGSTRTKSDNISSTSTLLQSFTSSSANQLLTTASSLSTTSTPILQPTQILVKDANQRPLSTQRQISCPASIPTLTLPSSNNSKLLLVTTGKNTKTQELPAQFGPSSTFILNTGEKVSSQLHLSNTIALPTYSEAQKMLNASR